MCLKGELLHDIAHSYIFLDSPIIGLGHGPISFDLASGSRLSAQRLGLHAPPAAQLGPEVHGAWDCTATGDETLIDVPFSPGFIYNIVLL